MLARRTLSREVAVMERTELVTIVTQAVQGQLELAGDSETPVDEESVLLGSDTLIDSLGLVTVIIEVEQAVLERYDVSVSLVDDKAMSARNSPFRTVGSLADHAFAAVEELKTG
jgi:acyl carrier protein